MPTPFHGVVTGGMGWASRTGADDFELETGAFTGLAPRLGFGANLKGGDHGHGWNVAAVAPHFQVQLTPPSASWPVRVALLAGYELAVTKERVEHHGSHGSDVHEDHDDSGHDHGLSDAATADDLFHGHAGIHRHGENHFFGRLIIESDLTSADKVLVNVIAVVPERGSAAWGYAAGYRHAFHHALALGVEAIGDFGDGDEHEILAAAYVEPVDSWLLRLGAGFGLSDNAPDFSLRAGVVWRF